MQIIQRKATELLANEDQFVKDAVDRLFTYMGGYWFARQITPERFCVNGDCHRTNNDVESFNRYFNDLCDRFHQNFWDLTST
jgi:hypothetical protein